MKEQIRDYFEGILQIRDGTPEIITWVHNRIKTDGKARIAKEKKVTNGIDLYLSDQHYLQNLGRKLKEKFPGILKISMRQHTTDKMTSRLVYRVTVLFKVLPFKKGDILTIHGEQVELLRIANRAQVKDVKSGAKRDVDLELLRR